MPSSVFIAFKTCKIYRTEKVTALVFNLTQENKTAKTASWFSCSLSNHYCPPLVLPFQNKVPINYSLFKKHMKLFVRYYEN